MRSVIVLACLLLSALVGAGEAAPVTAAGGGKAAAAPKRLSALELVAEEEKWVFESSGVRRDVFQDLVAIMTLSGTRTTTPKTAPETDPNGGKIQPGQKDPNQSDELHKLVTFAQGEELRVRTLLAGKEYDKAIKAADTALKQLEPHATKPEIMAVIESIRMYRFQAEAAKRRDEAQAAFDGMKIKVQGVLWSQTGIRMAIVDGETQAKMVNDRIKDKDCTILYIDQDRVVFRFIYATTPFEFPVYVEQQTARKP